VLQHLSGFLVQV